MLRKDYSHLKGFFFDLDGTLIDTAPDFVVTVNTLRQRHNLPPLTDKEISMHVSTGAGGLVQACLPFEDEQSFEKRRQELLDLYGELNHPHSALFPDAEKLLNRLDVLNIPWGIVTNKPEKYAIPLIKRLNLDNRLVCLLCPDHVKNRKPDPESLFLAAKMAQITPEECVYFGDHLRDIDAGKAAKMLTASVGFGYIEPDDDALSWNADYHFDSFTQIYNHFLTE